MIDRASLEARARALGFSFPLANSVRAAVWSMVHAENALAADLAQFGRLAAANEQMAEASERMADGVNRPG
ncbi:MAG: hypothetical protein ACK56C_05130 [Alphaproteobacteria bacterium]|jgi:hypothetical protein